MKSGFEVVKDHVKVLQDAIDTLTKSDVYVGIPEAKTKRKNKQPITNAALGYIHDNGSPENNIPARPFMVPGIKACQDLLNSIFKKAGENALDGKPHAADKGLHAAGAVARDSIKAVIVAGIPPKLSDKTLAARRRNKRTGTTPLIDTAQLLNSITYVIRKRNG